MIKNFIFDVFHISSADFFNIDINHDTPKFIQPYTVENLSSDIAKECNDIAVDFFNTVHTELVNKNFKKAKELFCNYLTEPKENCLGYAQTNTKGKGIKEMAGYAMNIILNEPHLINEITHIADLQLYNEQLMHDRISDIYTNVTRLALNKYTLEQCKKYNMEHLISEQTINPYWDITTHSWVTNQKERMLVIDGKQILLVPKNFLQGSYGPILMYRHVILPTLIERDLFNNQSSLIRERRNGEKYITKKEKNFELRNTGFIPSKRVMIEFAKNNSSCTLKLRKQLEENRNKKNKGRAN